MLEYVSCSCNKTSRVLCWGKNGKVCYGSCNSVCIVNPESPVRVETVLVGHKDRVNSVKWISRGDAAECEVVSVSVDKTAIIYKLKADNEYCQVACLSGHTASVTSVNTFYTQDQKTLIATAAADSSVKVWCRRDNEDSFTETHELNLGNGFFHDLAFTAAPQSDAPLLVCCGDDPKVRIYVPEDSGTLRLLGHLTGLEDWARGISITTDDSGDVLLAVCSQDTYVRVWRLSDSPDATAPVRSIKELGQHEQIKLHSNIYKYAYEGKERGFAVTLETVLQGHEGWVYSIEWQPKVMTADGVHQPLSLLSASMDKSIVVWSPDPASGVWIEQARLGDVGGSSLGYYGAVWGPDGSSIMSHGFQGGLRRWTQQSHGSWSSAVTCGGHNAPVHDLYWQPSHGHFLLSVSQDQTTRCHSYWNTGNLETSSWHEIARPQVHGYDMQCITMIDSLTFASGADEKVIRVFRAPKNFVDNLSSLRKTEASYSTDPLPEGASVPALGLSNKAVFLEDLNQPRDHIDEQYPEHAYQAVSGRAPPSEGDLLQNTLWPELHKLYGHGYELYSLAADPRGRYLASACRAAQAEQAAVLLWSCSTWQQVAVLEGHSLTVTQLAFSHSGDRLLSVSRDRTWTVYAETPGGAVPYQRVAHSDKKTGVHTRIIWSCCWSHDDKYFITVSRDKNAVLWSEGSPPPTPSALGNYHCVGQVLTLANSITAVDMAPCMSHDDQYIAAFGLDDGRIYIYTWSHADSWRECLVFAQTSSHHKTVTQLSFRPVPGSLSDPSNTSLLQLASCGADHAVRVYTIDISQLSVSP